MRKLGIVLVLLLLTACSTTPTPTYPMRLDPLTRDGFNLIVGTWPLKVDKVTPVCGKHVDTIGVEYNGIIYALNGTAKTWEHWTDLHPIWANDPTFPSIKIDESDLLNYVMLRCENKDAW